ncbi:pectinesterase family protein [Olivibacter sitiensis]|uniref:pectinesterase family protein n=1 Tax=Olivibacter sitiensis TaxID=376470 RepID=UPI0004060560|nr:pectinesterase family protein [Olivibacter sitiensis]
MISKLKIVGFILSVLGLLSLGQRAKLVVWVVGDSTMAIKAANKYPETGWGVPFANYFDDRVRVENKAMNGRSTKSFIDEGRWQYVCENLKQGDYVFIQFGHNDEKMDKPEVGTSLHEYQYNLSFMIGQVRDKGAFPILLTPIARRNFVNGRLQDTHRDYPKAMKQVADSLDVPLIDMTAMSSEFLSSLGADASKELFLHLEPGDKNYPEGVADDTHLNEAGAKAIADLVVDGLRSNGIPLVAFLKQSSTLVVAQDGTGDFTSVQQAIDAVPDDSPEEHTIYIKKGIYKERLVLPASKKRVKMIGEDVNATVLTFDNYASKVDESNGKPFGTTGSSSFFIYADDFVAENITFENSAGPVGQAVAVNVVGNRVAFLHCRFLGFQDTLYTKGPQDDARYQSLQYYRDCYIEGTVDFIFGAATAYFENCILFSKSAGYVTAASTPQDRPYGYVFHQCRLEGTAPEQSVYLGRPWRPYGHVAFIDCFLGGHIKPAGWDNWGNSANEQTANYVEYNSHGPGTSATRVPWSTQLSPTEIGKYAKEKVLAGWDMKF